jgi:hypothetical protein
MPGIVFLGGFKKSQGISNPDIYLKSRQAESESNAITNSNF